MNIKKIFKVIAAIVAIAGVAAAVYVAVQKLTATKKPEYFDDNDFFECDNDLEVVEAKEEAVVVEEEKVVEEAPKKKSTKKTATK